MRIEKHGEYNEDISKQAVIDSFNDLKNFGVSGMPYITSFLE